MAEPGIYRGDGERRPGAWDRMPPPPPWREFHGGPGEMFPHTDSNLPAGGRRAHTYRPTPEAVDAVNAALILRRPLLVTGRPGTGKSTLAHHIAYELDLGPVLTWPITSRSTLTDGLYRYDAIGRLHDANMAGARPDIGRYVRLGPLGTALLPWARPRALLIDEFDKSDIDLPNDLLHVFEEGQFEIPQLARLPDDQREVAVMTDDRRRAVVVDGSVRCAAFPVVVVTSNGERSLPPAFLRRCIQLVLPEPSIDQLRMIVTAHLGRGADEQDDVLDQFVHRRGAGDTLATDQLLNAVFLAMSQRGTTDDRRRLTQHLLRSLEDYG
ncbi:AAA family ATPase [Paractinoplanes rishiriensis]|uniref:AAA family ATPase n=1 Tax=Paractinoplanes rishiriensis TaxID=1050105 RepID=UPI001EF2D0D1|nr:MoxR family ATPase [Actinoplanes rishiriensis]